MSSLRELQARVAATLLDIRAVAPAEIRNDGLERQVRFSVHQNNVRVSLRTALENTFPVTRALVGNEFFAAMANRFVRANPPVRGWLSAYGGDLPNFIAAFTPASTVPYLADMSRLEWLRVLSAQAPSHSALDLAALGAFDGEAMASVRLHLHPAGHLFRSVYPLLAIWRAHQSPGGTDWIVDLDSDEERVLVSRLGVQVVMQALSPGDYVLLEAAAAGDPFSDAVIAAHATDDAFDLAASLARHAPVLSYSYGSLDASSLRRADSGSESLSTARRHSRRS